MGLNPTQNVAIADSNNKYLRLLLLMLVELDFVFGGLKNIGGYALISDDRQHLQARQIWIDFCRIGDRYNTDF